jgi:hypothetical protein
MAAAAPIDYWTFFAGEAKRGNSPLYEHLSLGIGGDDRLKAIAARARKGQPPANLILAAVHYLLLEGAAHELADHYPSVRPNASPKGAAFPAFRDFCLQHESALIGLIESRVTNTNEVARSTALYPAFDFLARETGEVLHLVEIGPSSGFNLNWDRYRYRYGRGAETVLERGQAGAHLTLDAQLRGEATPPLSPRLPSVATRLGLELNPVDLTRREDRQWLKALIWPELGARFARFDAAVKTALEHPARIWSGDALELLPTALEQELPPSGIAVVFHSYVTYQFSDAMRQRLEEILTAASLKRPLYRVSVEWDGGHYPLIVGRYDGARDKRTIALCDPHGAWLEWRGDQDAN